MEGEVTKVLNFGAFVMLPEGIEGLVHESEMDIVGPGYPQDVVASGEHVQVQVVDIDPKRQRMGLRLKKVIHDEQVTCIKENPGNAEDVEGDVIKDLSLLGAAYDSHSQDLTSEMDVAEPPGSI